MDRLFTWSVQDRFLKAPTSSHPLSKESVILTVSGKGCECYNLFLMTAEWSPCAWLEYGIPGLFLTFHEDVVNGALISLGEHLCFTLWTSPTDGWFPGVTVFCSLIYGLLLRCITATFVPNAFCIDSCNFPEFRFCFY